MALTLTARDNEEAPHRIVLFVKPPIYSPRHHFHKIIEKLVRANIKRRFSQAMRQVSGNLAGA
ncbi:hypothetical protein [Azospirillum sp.]|uniref:hypothetical protein n=1 Tax=Azospirillum sp. TaxID=34012 RepID=UPI00260EC59B|nr:hypothetical protein [Azospirillum sp.]